MNFLKKLKTFGCNVRLCSQTMSFVPSKIFSWKRRRWTGTTLDWLLDYLISGKKSKAEDVLWTGRFHGTKQTINQSSHLSKHNVMTRATKTVLPFLVKTEMWKPVDWDYTGLITWLLDFLKKVKKRNTSYGQGDSVEQNNQSINQAICQSTTWWLEQPRQFFPSAVTSSNIFRSKPVKSNRIFWMLILMSTPFNIISRAYFENSFFSFFFSIRNFTIKVSMFNILPRMKLFSKVYYWVSFNVQ